MSSPVVSNEMYVILGATGHTDSVVADFLLSKGQKVRVIGRDAGRLQRFVDKGAEAFTADIQHGSHQVAYHVMQKAVASDAINQQFSVWTLTRFPARRENGSDRCRHRRFDLKARPWDGALVRLRIRGQALAGQIGIGGRKAQEIVFALEELC